MDIEIVELTQAMIDAEAETFCDPLRGCVPGDFAVWNFDIEGMGFYEPFLIGLQCLLDWKNKNPEPSILEALRLVEIAQDKRTIRHE